MVMMTSVLQYQVRDQYLRAWQCEVEGTRPFRIECDFFEIAGDELASFQFYVALG